MSDKNIFSADFGIFRKISKRERNHLRNVASNAIRLLRASMRCFEDDNYPLASFLSITSIEEMGKFTLLRFDYRIKRSSGENKKGLTKAFYDHRKKQPLALIMALLINAGADRRIGGIVGKYIRMANDTTLMNLRNSCLYVEKDGTTPHSKIVRNTSIELIVVGYECLAELINVALLGWGDSSADVKRWQLILKRAEKFEKKYLQ